MTSFAVIAAWDGRQIESRQAAQLVDSLRPQFTDGTASIDVPSAAAAVGLCAVDAREAPETSIFVDRARKRLFVGDVRLYDRAKLIERLGGAKSGDSDLCLIAEAFDRFGPGAVSLLVGDFAIVVWEWESRVLFALRDHFGMKPIYYRLFPGGIAVASAVPPLLIWPSPSRAIDDQTALDYLLFRYAHLGRTFFRDIRQVRPAHYITVSSKGLEQSSYWNPPEGPLRISDQEGLEEWRRLFRVAVQDRIASSFPVAAHLSGGLDSGSIVGAAHQLYERGRTNRPKFFMASAQFPGMSCDETEHIDEVAKASPLFSTYRWDATVPNADDFEAPLATMPGLREGMGRGPRTEIAALHARGVRVVLAGSGGDELGWSHGIFRELLVRGRFLTLAKELVSWGSVGGAWHGLRMNLTGFRLRQLPQDPPEWLGPKLLALYPGAADDLTRHRFGWRSPVRSETWTAMHLPHVSLATEATVTALSEAGMELRLPYRDVRLVEFVIRLPWQLKLPRGDTRRLQRRAVAAFLPPSVSEDRAKSRGDSAVAHQIAANLPRIREVIEGRRWDAGDYVKQRGARRLFREIWLEDPELRRPREWNLLWQIAVFETWLRRLGELYSGCHEV